MENLSIGKVAQQADLSIDTIRYYERAGLIPPPARRDSGYRSYGSDVVKRLQFIRRAKDLGFTLSEISGRTVWRWQCRTVSQAPAWTPVVSSVKR